MEGKNFNKLNENIPGNFLGAQKWMSRLNKIIEKDPTNLKLDNEKLASRLKISKRDLFRKVKKLTGLSPQKYLKQYYLNQAMENLKSGKYKTVKETSHALGYTNVSYFITQFEKEFGKKPFQVLKEQGWR